MKEEFKKYSATKKTEHQQATKALESRLNSKHNGEIAQIPRATETESVLMKKITQLESRLTIAAERQDDCIPGEF